MFYRNASTVSEPVSLPGCPEPCSLEDFKRLTHDVIPQDRKKECQIKEEASDTGKHNRVHSEIAYMFFMHT